MSYDTRMTARAIMLTPRHEVLLIRVAFPWYDHERWILPGGGIDEGEDARAAVVREVFEETGASDIAIAGETWRQVTVIETINRRLDQRFFLVPTERFDPEPTALSEPEMDWVREYRWWTAEALASANAVIDPETLAENLRALIVNGVPESPIDIGEPVRT